MNRIIAVINQKGGVGKTTTVINIGAYLARAARKVLIIDADPQGNATSGLGVDKHSITSSLYDVLLSKKTVQQATLETRIPNLFLVPANAGLVSAEVDMVNIDKGQQLLSRQLLGHQYDYVLIDCPPALGLLTINALAAADALIIPVQTEYYALEGLSQLLSVVQEVKQTLNPSLELLGLILTMYDSRTSLSIQVKAEVQKHFDKKVFNTIVPRNVRLAEAPSYGLTVYEHDKWSKGARAYKQLTKEVIKRVENI